MPLPRLGHAPRASKGLKLPSAGKIQTEPKEDKYTPAGLSMSREEEWIAQYLAKRQGYWYQQKQFGRRGQPRNTSADFISDYYKAVIQADGAYFHDPKEVLDEVLSSVIRQRGYRVYRFRYPSFEYVQKNFPVWYTERFS